MASHCAHFDACIIHPGSGHSSSGAGEADHWLGEARLRVSRSERSTIPSTVFVRGDVEPSCTRRLSSRRAVPRPTRKYEAAQFELAKQTELLWCARALRCSRGREDRPLAEYQKVGQPQSGTWWPWPQRRPTSHLLLAISGSPASSTSGAASTRRSSARPGSWSRWTATGQDTLRRRPLRERVDHYHRRCDGDHLPGGDRTDVLGATSLP